MSAPFARARRVLPLFLLQYALSAADLALDVRYPFSDTKSTASALPKGARIVAAAEWRSFGVMFWRPDLQMRSESWRGRPFRYISPDTDWQRRAPVSRLVAEECSAAPEGVYFAGLAESLGSLATCAERVPYPKTPLVDHPFTWESFDLFSMRCGCVSASARPR